MKLHELAKKAAALPSDADFEWRGPEHWHDDVFEREVRSLKDLQNYVDVLRKRMAEQGMALFRLQQCYKQLRDAVLEAEVL